MIYYFIACLSGILLGLSWIVSPIFAFIALLPLRWLAGKQPIRTFLAQCYVSFLVWHILAAWWLPYEDTLAGIVMFLIVSALMCMPMGLAYLLTHKKRTSVFASILLIISWVAYEYLQYQSDFLWSWLTLGNCFGAMPSLVPFYTITGVLGGSVWIWIVNLCLYHAIFTKIPIQRALSLGVVMLTFIHFWLPWLVWLCLPDLLITWKKPHSLPKKVVVVQPNIDPYTQKFINTPQYIPAEKQAQILIETAKKSLPADLVVFPEATLGKWFEESGLNHVGNYPVWDTLRMFFDKYPETAFLIGFNTYRWVHGEEIHHITAHQVGAKEYKKRYNSMLLYQKGQAKQFHYKSKRVPTGEHLPLPHFLKNIFPAISNTITPEDAPKPLSTKMGVKLASLICYESTYGAYVGALCRQGAGILCVSTEDAYWRNTSQPLQHLYIDRLRALEHNRILVRSSNHGYSCFIDQNGDLHQLLLPNSTKSASFLIPSGNIKSPSITFYSYWGDWVGKLACLLCLLIFLLKTIRFDKMLNSR